MTTTNKNPTFIAQYQQRIDSVMDAILPASNNEPGQLHSAMRYTVLNQGKRIRPMLVYATGELVKATPKVLDIIAASIEFIHCYSLVHDDLPAMDNDDLRRGKPTCHKAFDEATAILVGDALQNLAFQILADAHIESLSPTQQLHSIRILAHACSTTGIVGGQAIDVAATGTTLKLATLERMHQQKTGALIQACCDMVIASHPPLSSDLQKHLQCFAKHIGLAFQIQDDILDIESTTSILGKTQGADASMAKATYPGLVGLEAAKQKVSTLYNEAMSHLAHFDKKADNLRLIAQYIVHRTY